jgi:hypothetical protein
MLYRSSWMPKGANGNTHGYSAQTFVASLSLGAETLPVEHASKFSEAEVRFLEYKLFQPAHVAAQQKERAEEAREADPMWRLDEATRLTLEAAERSERNVVPNVKVLAVQSALNMVRTISPSQLQGQNAGQTGAPVTTPVAEQGRSDPLKDALTAIIKAARDAVMAGRYGTAPAEGVRASYAYRKWAEIFDAIEGTGNDSLLRALQSKGFAKTRGK